jgi:non-specific protein-tyrosine kinase
MNTGIGLLAGLCLGVLLAVLLSELDTHAHSAEEVGELLTWPVVGTIWRATEPVFQPQALNAEAYRILRTNIGFSGIDRPLRTIMVTSTVPGEGKSTVAANLALFLAKAGKNTLLIDADLRRPTQHTLFHLGSEKPGLSNAVLALSQAPTALSEWANAVPDTQSKLDPYMYSVGYANLRVMPAGPLPPNPSELLDSQAMQRLINTVASSGVDLVIFDAPPAFGISDASILAARVDGALVVVDPATPTRAQMLRMKGVLEKAGARIVGCVVTKLRPTRQDTSSAAYYLPQSPELPPTDAMSQTTVDQSAELIVPTSVIINAVQPVQAQGKNPVNTAKGMALVPQLHHENNGTA